MIHEPSNPGPSGHEPDIDPQGLWQSQKKEYDAMSLAQIHNQALAFERTVRKRNTIEYVTYAFAIGLAVAVEFEPKMTPVIRAGIALMVLGLAFVAWQLHRRASAENAPPVGESLVEAYRNQLIRQRDAGRTGFWWYLAPQFPGLVVLIAGLWLKQSIAGEPRSRLVLETGLLALAMVAGFAWAAYLIRAGVKNLQKKIDEL
jgi:hypothetical protein